MPHGIKDWAISIAFSAVLAFIWRWLAKLAENAMLTWSDDQIAYFFGFSSPEASTVISWVIPIILGIATILAYHVVQSRIFTHKATNTAVADNFPTQEIAPRQLPKAAHERIPLLDIIEMARKAGWNINAYQSNDPSELTARLNQSAADGTIKFWGRKYEYDLGETAVTNFPLIEIPESTLQNSVSNR